MTFNRWDKKVDSNQKELVEILRKRGFQVHQISKPFDLIVAKNGKSAIVEIKDPKKEGWKNEYTPAQKKFLASWQGGPIITLRSLEDALNFKLE